MNIDGIDYIEQGSGEPVVFLHGIGGGAASFTKQLNALDEFRCIAWNMPGYESSTVKPESHSFANLSIALGNCLLAFEHNHQASMGLTLLTPVSSHALYTFLSSTYHKQI